MAAPYIFGRHPVTSRSRSLGDPRDAKAWIGAADEDEVDVVAGNLGPSHQDQFPLARERGIDGERCAFGQEFLLLPDGEPAGLNG